MLHPLVQVLSQQYCIQNIQQLIKFFKSADIITIYTSTAERVVFKMNQFIYPDGVKQDLKMQETMENARRTNMGEPITTTWFLHDSQNAMIYYKKSKRTGTLFSRAHGVFRDSKPVFGTKKKREALFSL